MGLVKIKRPRFRDPGVRSPGARQRVRNPPVEIVEELMPKHHFQANHVATTVVKRLTRHEGIRGAHHIRQLFVEKCDIG